MDSKKIRYLAGFAFALNALLSFSTNTFETFIGILVWVAPLLMAIALFADIPYLVAAGAGIISLRNLYSFIRALPYVSSDIAGRVLNYLLIALAYGFIILLVFNRKNAVKLSWVAAIFFVLSGKILFPLILEKVYVKFCHLVGLLFSLMLSLQFCLLLSYRTHLRSNQTRLLLLLRVPAQLLPVA